MGQLCSVLDICMWSNKDIDKLFQSRRHDNFSSIYIFLHTGGIPLQKRVISFCQKYKKVWYLLIKAKLFLHIENCYFSLLTASVKKIIFKIYFSRFLIFEGFVLGSTMDAVK